MGAVRWVSCALLVVQGLTGLLGGVQLALDPSGRRVGLAPAWLQGSPFDDYLWPGLILGSVLGLVQQIGGQQLDVGRRVGDDERFGRAQNHGVDSVGTNFELGQ